MGKRFGKAGGKGKWWGTTQPPSPSPSGPGSYVFLAITGPFWNHCRTPSRHQTRSEQHRRRERSGPKPDEGRHGLHDARTPGMPPLTSREGGGIARGCTAVCAWPTNPWVYLLWHVWERG